MCIGIPLQAVSVDGTRAVCRDERDGALVAIDLSLVGPVRPGDWLLTFLGVARAVLEEVQARQILGALRSLAAVATGGDIDAGFADLIRREPQLPPHLDAARRAGAKEG